MLAQLRVGAEQSIDRPIELADLGLELLEPLAALDMQDRWQPSALIVILVTTIALAGLFVDSGFAFVNQHFELFLDRAQRPSSHRLAFQTVKGNELGIDPIVLGASIIGGGKKLDLRRIEHTDRQAGTVQCAYQGSTVDSGGFQGEMDRLEFDPPGLEPFKKGFETRGIVGQPSPPQTDFFGVEQTEVKSLLCDIVAKEVTFFHPTELQ